MSPRTLALVLGAATWVSCGDAAVVGVISDDAGAEDARAERDGSACTLLCGPLALCCTDAEECVADRCVPACENARCGIDDGLCCGVDERCHEQVCDPYGDTCSDERECPYDFTCEPLVGRCTRVLESATCRLGVSDGAIAPFVEWRAAESMTSATTLMPTLLQATDDDGDGRVDARDTPDVVTNGDQRPGSPHPFVPVVVRSGADGSIVASSVDANTWSVATRGSAATGDLDGDGRAEIVVAMQDVSASPRASAPVHLVVLEVDGAALRVRARSTAALGPMTTTAYVPSIANVDGVGAPEIFVAGSLFDADANLLHSYPSLGVPTIGTGRDAPFAPVLTDLDDDDQLEILGAGAAYRWNAPSAPIWTADASQLREGLVAISAFSALGSAPVLVVVDDSAIELRDARDGRTLATRTVVAMPLVSTYAAPVVANMDADGDPEIGAVFSDRVVVLDVVAPSTIDVVMTQTVRPAFGRIGLAVFDFDGDSRTELVVATSCHVRVVRVEATPMSTAPLWYASLVQTFVTPYPVIADVDNDGNAELLVTGAGSGTPAERSLCMPDMDGPDLPFAPPASNGLLVYGDRADQWVPTRPVWNQFASYLDNVLDDGTIPPRTTEPSWRTHRTYRTNRLVDPGTIALAPDLTIIATSARTSLCPDEATLRARVQNRGTRGVGPGVAVAFYGAAVGGTRPLLGVARTTRRLLAGEGAWVELRVEHTALDENDRLRFLARVDIDEMDRSEHRECDESNNASSESVVVCGVF